MGMRDVRIKDPNGYVLIVGQGADHEPRSMVEDWLASFQHATLKLRQVAEPGYASAYIKADKPA